MDTSPLHVNRTRQSTTNYRIFCLLKILKKFTCFLVKRIDAKLAALSLCEVEEDPAFYKNTNLGVSTTDVFDSVVFQG